MDQALAHLVNNARDAGARNVDIAIDTTGADILLTVRDDGRGMDPRTRDHMFDPFFTTKGQGEGTGLSLSTVLGIVDGHGGTVEVDSSPGHGTSVGLRLPRAVSSEP
jgi:signal transduction histidine kinase